MFKFVHKLLSSFKIRARISEIWARIFSFVFANSHTNSYANSHVNFVHEIRTKFVIFDKLGKVHTNSREFAKVMLRMACTVYDMYVNNLLRKRGLKLYKKIYFEFLSIPSKFFL